MKLAKAIELKELTGQTFLNADPDEIDEADRLSVEAMKYLKRLRDSLRHHNFKLLPGETKD